MTDIVMGNVTPLKKKIEELEALVSKLQRELHEARSDLGYANDEIRERAEVYDWFTNSYRW